MAFSMAGLASTMQGADMAARQQEADTLAKNNAQRDQWKFDQEKRAADEQSRSDSILRGEDQGGLSSAKPATNGSKIMDSIKGLFSAAPAAPEVQPSPLNPAQQLEATKGQSGLPQGAGMADVAPKVPTAPLPYYKQAQARLDAYAQKNPNDMNAINAAQAKIDLLAKGDTDRAHAQFIQHGEDALQKFIASGGMNTSALDEVSSKHFPDGHTYATARNDDGSYTVTQTDTGMKGKPMSFDELGQRFTNLLHPDSYMSAHIKAQEAGLTEGAKLPSQQAIETTKGDQARKTENNKIDGEIRKDGATGQTGLRTAQGNQANAAASEHSASANGKNFDNGQKVALDKAKAELDSVNPQAEPSRYKQLQQKVARLTPAQANAGGLHTSISETDDGKKVPIITDPMTGQVFQGGNVIYQRGGVANQNQSPNQPPAPKSGDIIDGHRFKGGNPSSRDSWEPISSSQPAPQKSLADTGAPSQNGLSERSAGDVLSQARAIKAKYHGNLPSRYMSNSMSDNEQKIIDSANSVSPTWEKY
jgi:hypothetical protein